MDQGDEYLVDIHVGLSARAGLEDDEWEVIAPFPTDDLISK
jgi:hypothetical protein